jgi:hypothetical protein
METVRVRAFSKATLSAMHVRRWVQGSEMLDLSSDTFSRQLLLVLNFHVSTVINHHPSNQLSNGNNVMMSFFEDIASTPVPQPSVRQTLCPHAAHYVAYGS